MARVRGVLKAIALASWRETRTILSIAGQNLFLFIAFVALQPESAAFFVLLLAAVVICPLSADPMEKVPKDRWQLWPLSNRERMIVRAVSIALNPITWIAALLWLYANWRTGFEFVALVISGKTVLYFIQYASARLPQTNICVGFPHLPARPEH